MSPGFPRLRSISGASRRSCCAGCRSFAKRSWISRLASPRSKPGSKRVDVHVMLSCGEPSGDLYAGALVSSLRALEPQIDVFGFGGDRMASAGARLVGDYRGFSVTGLVEALGVRA